MRFSVAVLISLVIVVSASGEESGDESDRYIMNFDLVTRNSDGDDHYNINLQGIHLPDNNVLHGNDLGQFEYFFTVSTIDESKAVLTIEFYEYETRRKESDVVSEIVGEAEFSFGHPTQFQSKNDRFGIDLAFVIDQR